MNAKVEFVISMLNTAIQLCLQDENMDVDEAHVHKALWELINTY